jgi:K+-transporting ATPase ATPase C chain
MLMEVAKQLKTAFILLVAFTILTGFVYPSIVTSIANLLFPWQATGSLIIVNNNVIGSALIGQSFTDPRYFWGRPSATTPYPYNTENSSGSNFSSNNPQYIDLVKQRIANIQKFNPNQHDVIPADLVTASASGLDPDISPAAAFYQVPRIAKIRHVSEPAIQQLIINTITDRDFKLLGEQRVNVLQLNIALDHLAPEKNINGKKTLKPRNAIKTR